MPTHEILLEIRKENSHLQVTGAGKHLNIYIEDTESDPDGADMRYVGIDLDQKDAISLAGTILKWLLGKQAWRQ
jgi:hypothetical protein